MYIGLKEEISLNKNKLKIIMESKRNLLNLGDNSLFSIASTDFSYKEECDDYIKKNEKYQILKVVINYV